MHQGCALGARGRETFDNGQQPLSCPIASIPHTAVQEVKTCSAMDVAVFLTSEHLSVVRRRMRATSPDTTPIPGPPLSWEGWPPPPLGPMPRALMSRLKSLTSPSDSPPSCFPAESRPSTRQGPGSRCTMLTRGRWSSDSQP